MESLHSENRQGKSVNVFDEMVDSCFGLKGEKLFFGQTAWVRQEAIVADELTKDVYLVHGTGYAGPLPEFSEEAPSSGTAIRVTRCRDQEAYWTDVLFLNPKWCGHFTIKKFGDNAIPIVIQLRKDGSSIPLNLGKQYEKDGLYSTRFFSKSDVWSFAHRLLRVEADIIREGYDHYFPLGIALLDDVDVFLQKRKEETVVLVKWINAKGLSCDERDPQLDYAADSVETFEVTDSKDTNAGFHLVSLHNAFDYVLQSYKVNVFSEWKLVFCSVLVHDVKEVIRERGFNTCKVVRFKKLKVMSGESFMEKPLEFTHGLSDRLSETKVVTKEVLAKVAYSLAKSSEEFLFYKDMLIFMMARDTYVVVPHREFPSEEFVGCRFLCWQLDDSSKWFLCSETKVNHTRTRFRTFEKEVQSRVYNSKIDLTPIHYEFKCGPKWLSRKSNEERVSRLLAASRLVNVGSSIIWLSKSKPWKIIDSVTHIVVSRNNILELRRWLDRDQMQTIFMSEAWSHLESSYCIPLRGYDKHIYSICM